MLTRCMPFTLAVLMRVLLLQILELDQIDNGDAIQSAIAKQQRTSRVTVPQVCAARLS